MNNEISKETEKSNNAILYGSLVAFSIGSLGILGYFLMNKKRKKINVVELNELFTRVDNIRAKIEDVNLVKKELQNTLEELMNYDWESINIKNNKEREFLLNLKDIIHFKLNYFDESYERAFELIKISLEKFNHMMNMKQSMQTKNLTLSFLMTHMFVLSTRAFNYKLKNSQEIVEEIKKIWMLMNLDRKQLRSSKMLEMSFGVRKSLVKVLMMRRRYAEVLEKHFDLIEEYKTATPNLDMIEMMVSIWNASLKEGTIKQQQKSKEVVKNLVMETFKTHGTGMLNISVSDYDLYFDSFIDSIGEDGLKTKMTFCVFNNGVPVDCKIKLTDVDEKIVYKEQFVKKKELPVEIKNKELLITQSREIELQKDSMEHVRHIFKQESTSVSKDEPKDVFLGICIENRLNIYNTKSSEFKLASGIYTITFSIEEDKQFKEIGKLMAINTLNSQNTSLDKLLRELNMLPKEPVPFIVYLFEFMSIYLDSYHTLDFEKPFNFIKKGGIDMITDISSEELKVFIYTVFISSIYYDLCLLTFDLDFFKTFSVKILEILENHKGEMGRNKSVMTNLYRFSIKFFLYFEAIDLAEDCK
eukprot:TRINITY_DN1114_c0_g1_i6.p1 TRINITY_DN1114_c0_g1~~TRINITY_DN1114_c0_g1_i6.p1  ORF type:complete len:596 (+),score=141.18 TRINITY_DN1114_c0_g1_i6:32-1789(+)